MTQLIFGICLIAFAAILGFYGQQIAREGWTKISSSSSTAGDGNETASTTTMIGPVSSANQSGLTAGVINGSVTINIDSATRPSKAEMSDSKSVSTVPAVATGGRGGHANATDGGVALGGKGGRGGVGPGGAGGNAEAAGAGSMAIGGDGGDSGRSDGRGGKGGASPLKRLTPEALRSWGLTGNEGYGQGGSGGNSTEYDRSLMVLNAISAEYIANNPNEKLVPMPGVLMPPVAWVNERLLLMRETFRVELIDHGTDFLLHQNKDR